MARNKRGGGADDIYTNHLYGSPFKANPANNRLAIMERMYLRVLTELASNRFKWSGMPDTVDVRFMELTLFQRALSLFYWDKDYDRFLALKGGMVNFINMMDNPTSFMVVGNNFVSKTLGAYNPNKEYPNPKDVGVCVPIWSNYVRVPDWDIVRVYSQRLASMDLTIEINAANARRNKVVFTSDNTRLSMVNINRQIDEGQNLIQVSSEGPVQDMAFIQAVDLNIDTDAIEKLHIVRTRMWNECMGLLGINNANQDKKERLVADEVNANDDQTSMMRYVNLNSRRKAAEQINKLYGLNLEVEYYTDEPVPEPEPLAGFSDDEEDDDGDIHADAKASD